jgi:hypothetical protein
MATEFWEYDEWMPSLFKNIPLFFIPKAFQARDRILASIQKWYTFAYEHCDLKVEENRKIEWEQFFGSKLVRDHLPLFSAIDGCDSDALAAVDLGLM